MFATKNLYTFTGVYLIGALIFFVRTEVITAKKVISMLKEKNIDEDLELQVFNQYFSKILLQTIMMVVFPLAFYVYNWLYVYENAYIKMLASTGLLTLIWLILTGIVIRLVFQVIVRTINAFKPFPFVCPEMGCFWIAGPLMYGFLNFIYTKDYISFLMILAIVLGKYLWMDTFKFESVGHMRQTCRGYIDDNRTNLFLLVYQFFIMIFLVCVLKVMDTMQVEIWFFGCMCLLLGKGILPYFDIYLQKCIMDDYRKCRIKP